MKSTQAIIENAAGGLGIYVHVPFCSSKCPYCDFNSIASGRPPERRIIECVKRELGSLVEREKLARSFGPVESVYFGGGTPSVLSPGSIGAVIEAVHTSLPPGETTEVTLEANPESASPERLRGFLNKGVNRLSIGVQSFDDAILLSLGRGHGSDSARRAFLDAREAGFTNIGIDLIFGAPGQDAGVWERTLEETIGLSPEHVSVYGLTIEGGTAFHGLRREGRLPLPTEDEELSMYEMAVETLKNAGYLHYEISNFARTEELRSRHNMRYWTGGDYIGLGPGAHSYLSSPGWGRRRWNTANPTAYMESIEAAGTATAGRETLTREQAATERLMLALRTLDGGLDEAGFARAFGMEAKETLDWERVKAKGLLASSNGRLSLTMRGILFSNEIY